MDFDPEASEPRGEVANRLRHFPQAVEVEHVVSTPAELLAVSISSFLHPDPLLGGRVEEEEEGAGEGEGVGAQ